ncbi:antibiotic biosynthesis monooxygenase [Sandaracinobacter sp. RS1-74]|uniref:putative quinol monooxygenase n=1 Tax=Sandaracinobacteroides sayramensis TaxID=2913411 RepID=UPI001EDBBB5B|nr:putative quinol monooxygenase [Sandaracinobacteroides sayramensis]MCG2842020.1 antibiotic biosynthesis monooxygenase [Sandaracinobacteroides sayramensis]
MAEVAKIVLMRAKPGGGPALEAALRALILESGKEEGSVCCELHSGSADSEQFMVYERWSGDAAFDAHMAQPHVAVFLAATGELLAGQPEVLAFDHLP